ncbi:MAG: hypothetical protein O2816_00470 [Planctomycetota bacterium]|nr:hypothetical protein [Planctomycetota bacterium]
MKHLLSLAVLAAPTAAQVDVLILSNTPHNGAGCNVPDVQAKLQATGFFGNIDFFDLEAGSPTMGLLTTYDVALVWTDEYMQDEDLVGDRLADFVDLHHGVVTTMFSTLDKWMPGGRWESQGYQTLVCTGQQQHTQQFLGTVHVPGHALLAGVQSFDGGHGGASSTGSFRPTNWTVAPGATVIAEWTDGVPLVVQGANPRRIDLGFFPVSDACDPRFWDSSTDGARLLANALLVASGYWGDVGDRYCDPAVPNSTGQPARINGTGTASVAWNQLSLTASQLPHWKFGYFLNSQSAGSVIPPGSEGVLCLSGHIGRHTAQIQNSGEAGSISIDLDLNALPRPSGGPHAVLPGETWRFQAWFRDKNPVDTSNFTDALAVQFQ